MLKKILVYLLILLIILLAACSNNQIKDKNNWKVQSFKYTSQRNETVSLESLKGTPWIGMFIFTNCVTVCPPMTMNMTDLQKTFQEKGLEDYRIVGFSVDPEVDKPEVLTDYLDKYSVTDSSKWDLLTGYKQKEISNLAKKSFKTIVKDDPKSNQVIHGTSFYLVDKNGVVVKDYNGYSNVEFERIANDMKILIEEDKK